MPTKRYPIPCSFTRHDRTHKYAFPHGKHIEKRALLGQNFEGAVVRSYRGTFSMEMYCTVLCKDICGDKQNINDHTNNHISTAIHKQFFTIH